MRVLVLHQCDTSIVFGLALNVAYFKNSAFFNTFLVVLDATETSKNRFYNRRIGTSWNIHSINIPFTHTECYTVMRVLMAICFLPAFHSSLDHKENCAKQFKIY